MRQIKTADFVDVVLFADDIELGVDSIQQSGHRHWTDEAADGSESHNITEHYCYAVEHLRHASTDRHLWQAELTFIPI